MTGSGKVFTGVAEALRCTTEERMTMRGGLVAMGVPPHVIDELLDLSLHAVDQAVEALLTVLDRASDRATAFAGIGIAGPILQSRLESMLDAAKNASRAAGFEPQRVFPAAEGGAA
mgnify:CR=1 FL=1